MKKIMPLLVLCLSLLGCDPNGEQPVTPVPSGKIDVKILVLVIGGLGNSQMGDVIVQVEANCPAATVVNVGDDSAYAVDVTPYLEKYDWDRLVLVGHSFGGEKVVVVTNTQPSVAYLGMIDPVAYDPFWASSLPLPQNIYTYDCYERSAFFGPSKCKITGATEQTIKGGHNDIPHDPTVLMQIVQKINSLQPVQ